VLLPESYYIIEKGCFYLLICVFICFIKEKGGTKPP